MTTHHDLWTLQINLHPDMLAWPMGEDGIRRHPETGEPCLVVEGWEHSRFDKWSVHEVQDDGDRRTRFDLTTTESHAANWLADAWARWMYFDRVGDSLSAAAWKPLAGVVLGNQNPPSLLAAVAECLREMEDSDD